MAKIPSSKEPNFPEKYWNNDFLVMCTSINFVLISYLVFINFVQLLKRSYSEKLFIFEHLFNKWQKIKLPMGQNYQENDGIEIA